MSETAKREQRPLDSTLVTRVTEEERKLVEAAVAREEGAFVSTWIRDLLLDRLEELFGPQAVGRAGASRE